MSEPKVLHLLKTAVGASWALRQMRELVHLGIEVHAAMPPGPLVEQYAAAGIRVHLSQYDFPMSRPYLLPSKLASLRQLVEAIQPDVIHSHFVGTTLTLRLALGDRYPIPRIFQVPGPLHLEHPFFRTLEIRSATALDYWVGSCHWTCNRYRQAGIAENRIFLSYYGTDLHSFSEQSRGRLRNELRVGDKTKIIGMVAFMYAPKRFLGQTRGLKGHEDLIDALAICRKRNFDVVGVFVGGAWGNAAEYERRVRMYAQNRCGERAIFLGTRLDVAALYADFDLAIHPSHSENLGGASESLLMGVPTIATNVGGFPDIVRPGETGWLIPPRSPLKLADAIEDALSEPTQAKKMAHAGQQLVSRALDVRLTAKEIACIYQQILTQRAAMN